MNAVKKIHPDVFEPDVLVSVNDKWSLNLRMIDKINYLVVEIWKKTPSLHLYWYSFKYPTPAPHAVYKLLYKILLKQSKSAMCWKNKYHNLLHGPRKWSDNLVIFSDLIAFIGVQIRLLGSIIWCCSDV